jgi:uncharacterized protein YciI
MTFAEIQKIIEGMLAIGKDLQERQLELQEHQDRLQNQQERETERVNGRFQGFEGEIDRILAVQRELQESQIYLRDQQEGEIERVNGRFQGFEGEIDRILAVQRELQESQIYLRDQQERERETLTILRDEVFKLIEASNRSDRRIEQLVGYSIADESDRLNYLERVIKLEKQLG